MATIQHSVLTGTEIHEPKGANTATNGQVYVANGAGSGNWTNISASSFTGQIADFAWPVVQDGWLECDGSDINIATYGALYNVMTIQTTGTRTNGNNTITSIPSTTQFKVGYYIFGTGIPAGTTITTINSPTQITMSTNASSPGTSPIIISPWYLNTGTIRLPDLSTAGRYRRARSSTTAVGQTQTSQNLSHTHTVNGTTNAESQSITHNFSGTTNAMTTNNNVQFTTTLATFPGATGSGYNALVPPGAGGAFNVATNVQNIDHGHTFSGVTGTQNQNHTHAFGTTSAADGGAEARPVSIVIMTCIKT